jgi:hypothetical protein
MPTSLDSSVSFNTTFESINMFPQLRVSPPSTPPTLSPTAQMHTGVGIHTSPEVNSPIPVLPASVADTHAANAARVGDARGRALFYRRLGEAVEDLKTDEGMDPHSASITDKAVDTLRSVVLRCSLKVGMTAENGDLSATISSTNPVRLHVVKRNHTGSYDDPDCMTSLSRFNDSYQSHIPSALHTSDGLLVVPTGNLKTWRGEPEVAKFQMQLSQQTKGIQFEGLRLTLEDFH